MKAAGGSQLTYALRRRIRDVVRALPAAQVEPIAAALRSGLGSSGELDFAALLMAIHPHLETGAPPRPREGDYALTLPFADMVVDRVGGPKRPGRIDRRSVTRLVGVLAGERSTSALAIAMDAFRNLPQAVDAESEAAALAAIWTAADAALGNIADSAEPSSAHIEAMGTEAAAADLIEMARILRLGPEIHRLRGGLPPAPIAELSGNDIAAIREACDRVRVGLGPDAVTDFLHAVAGWLQRPEEILKAVRPLVARDRYGENWARQLASVVDRVMEALEAVPHSIPEEDDEEGAVIAAVGSAIRILRSFPATIGVPNRGEPLERITRVKAALAARVERALLENATAVITGCFLKGWDTGRTIFPASFDERLKSGAVPRAERRARSLSQILPYSEELGLGSRLRAQQAELRTAIEVYGERLTAGMDAGGGIVWMPAVMSLVHIMELLFGPEPADRFRRRAGEKLSRAA